MRLFQRLHRAGLIALLGALVTTAGCLADEGPVDQRAGRQTDPIINGATETGYRGVGAFIITEGMYGAICTGTVIADEWVLTAAHCVEGRVATDVVFCLDSDLTPILEGRDTGECFSARSLHPHPDFSMHDLSNDIALVNVRGLSGVPTFAYNSNDLSGYGGRTVTWVGYGLNRTRPDSGDGIKRRGTGQIRMIDWTHIYYVEEDQMPCRGDSGGPAFTEIGGEQRVIGVVSAGDETCSSTGIDTRVDYYSDWIAATMAGGSTPDCRITGGDCGSQACLPLTDGSSCFPSEGLGVGAACNPDPETWETAVPCSDGNLCIQVSADPTDGQCLHMCLGDGDCIAGEEYCHMFEDAGFGACVADGGGTDCNIIGGDCGPDGGCFPTTRGTLECFPSDGLGLDAACNPDSSTWENLPCADGLVCAQTTAAGDGICVAFCYNNTHCRDGEICRAPAFEGIDDIGICDIGECEDLDGDGACAESDCDDSNANVYPGAAETCGDGLDNNCNGQIDEGCGGPCTDADGDGVCVEAGDCNDSNPGINPGAAEVCDGLDNNCNGLIDGAEIDCGGGGGGGGSSRGCHVAPSGTGSPGSLVPALVTLLGLGWLASRRR